MFNKIQDLFLSENNFMALKELSKIAFVKAMEMSEKKMLGEIEKELDRPAGTIYLEWIFDDRFERNRAQWTYMYYKDIIHFGCGIDNAYALMSRSQVNNFEWSVYNFKPYRNFIIDVKSYKYFQEIFDENYKPFDNLKLIELHNTYKKYAPKEPNNVQEN